MIVQEKNKIPFEYLKCPHCKYIPQKYETMNIIKDGGICFGFVFLCNNCGKEYDYYPLEKLLMRGS